MRWKISWLFSQEGVSLLYYFVFLSGNVKGCCVTPVRSQWAAKWCQAAPVCYSGSLWQPPPSPQPGCCWWVCLVHYCWRKSLLNSLGPFVGSSGSWFRVGGVSLGWTMVLSRYLAHIWAELWSSVGISHVWLASLCVDNFNTLNRPEIVNKQGISFILALPKR